MNASSEGAGVAGEGAGGVLAHGFRPLWSEGSALDGPGLDGPGLDGPGLDGPGLAEWYAAPAPWLRANLAVTLDGAVAGPDGRSGSINNVADHVVFGVLRDWCDAVVVGAGTARAEGYRPASRPVVVVSARGEVPPTLLGGGVERAQGSSDDVGGGTGGGRLPGDGLAVAQDGAPRDGCVECDGRGEGLVLLVTSGSAPGLAAARRTLGDDRVLVLGDESVDLSLLRAALAARGWQRLLAEGGPGLLRSLLAVRAIDELTLTVLPRLIAGEGPRLLGGDWLDVPLHLAGLLTAADGTLFGRWQPEYATYA